MTFRPFSGCTKRERGWREIVEAASEAQAHPLIGFDFDRVGAPELVDGEYLLYFAIGRINPDLVALQESLDVAPGPDDEDDPYFDVPDYYRDHPAEYRALHHVCRSHRAPEERHARGFHPGVRRSPLGAPVGSPLRCLRGLRALDRRRSTRSGCG
ncbi:hypothetical protein [Nocardiopsis alba]|uniref:hypothetical protein n=1 Tax=Nocardiopsis alba TaxID=53437 RepID=UPI0033A3A69E